MPKGARTRKRSARLNEIANSLGVSASTVSRALKRPELVRAETREEILAAAREAGYPAARQPMVSLRRTGSIGLIVPDLENPFFAVLAKAAMNEARRHDYSLVVADTNEEPLGEAEIIALARRHVDGLIIASSRLDDGEFGAMSGSFPLVSVNRKLPGVPSILIDNRSGIAQAVEHLAALGHRVIAYVEGPRSSWSNRQRRETFIELTQGQAIESKVLGPYSPRFEGGVQAADVALAQDVTAIIAYNDLMAFGVLSRLATRGIPVPAAMSVIGFDDVPAAAMWSPTLTTVASATASIGKTAVRDLLRIASGKSPAANVDRQLVSHLVVRGSTGPRA